MNRAATSSIYLYTYSILHSLNYIEFVWNYIYIYKYRASSLRFDSTLICFFRMFLVGFRCFPFVCSFCMCHVVLTTHKLCVALYKCVSVCVCVTVRVCACYYLFHLMLKVTDCQRERVGVRASVCVAIHRKSILFLTVCCCCNALYELFIKRHWIPLRCVCGTPRVLLLIIDTTICTRYLCIDTSWLKAQRAGKAGRL